jgi:outer membrane protein OmpA-like peptidoglycan-associated protein
MSRLCVLLLFAGPAMMAQGTVPLYKVTVIERSLQAVNYQYRSGPTEIDLKGTVLLPKGKGRATVESRRGRTEIDAKVQNLTPPTPFGQEYLTYVLWAITPEGAPHNICELLPNGSNSASVHVSTELQAFAIIVTAEPYSAVRQPSDVVVLENFVRPETIGTTQPVLAKAELLPRGHYTLELRKDPSAELKSMPTISMSEYEQLSEIYQAENAMGFARVAKADQFAPETYAKAQQLLNEAQQRRVNKMGASFVVQSARAAAQTADDARSIAEKRIREDKYASARKELDIARQEKDEAVAEAQRARADADAARAQIDSGRTERERPEPQASASIPMAAPPPPVATVPAAPPPPPADETAPRAAAYRAGLLRQLNSVMAARDTPRGLVITVPDSDFSGGALSEGAAASLARIATIAAQPGLRVNVEGYADSGAGETLSSTRAEAVRDALVSRGLSSNAIVAHGLGSARPVTSNATEAGRVENRRVEIIVSGVPIGSAPLWDRTYSLKVR